MILKIEAVEKFPSRLLLAPESGSFPSTQIEIELIDINDNAPIFQPSSLYSFTVSPTAEVGTVIGQVSYLLHVVKK